MVVEVGLAFASLGRDRRDPKGWKGILLYGLKELVGFREGLRLWAGGRESLDR